MESVSGTMVHGNDAVNYSVFKSRFWQEGEDEQCLLGKYYIVRKLLSMGCTTPFLDAIYRFGRPERKVKVDVYGRCSHEALIGLCQSGATRGQLYRKLAYISSAPARVIVMLPFTEPVRRLKERFPLEFSTGKFTVSFIPDANEDLTGFFKDALEITSILANRTRMQILLPLLLEPTKKSLYRGKINPKLVYENLPILISRGLVRETGKNTYTLTRIGDRVLAEYLRFLEEVRKTLESSE